MRAPARSARRRRRSSPRTRTRVADDRRVLGQVGARAKRRVRRRPRRVARRSSIGVPGYVASRHDSVHSGGDRRRPVAARDDAEVEVDRMRERVEGRRRIGVQLAPRERAARARPRTPASIALKPSCASATWAGVPAMSTWNQRTPTCEVGMKPGYGSGITAASGCKPGDDALKRSVSAALLLDHGLQLHRRERREPEPPERRRRRRRSRRDPPSCRPSRGRRASRRRVSPRTAASARASRTRGRRRRRGRSGRASGRRSRLPASLRRRCACR